MIKLKNVSKKYGDRFVLNDLNLEINKGEFVAIVGKSGSGKSTILNIIGKLEKPTSGTVEILDDYSEKKHGSNRLDMYRYILSYLFQNYALIDNATVDENMKIAAKYVKESVKVKQQIIADALNKVGLSGIGKQQVYSLSGGEQQRLSIARLLVKPSQIILADEPTGNLDHENAEEIFELLKMLNRNYGKTIIVVTHSKEFLSYFDRVIDLNSL